MTITGVVLAGESFCGGGTHSTVLPSDLEQSWSCFLRGVSHVAYRSDNLMICGPFLACDTFLK